MKAFTCLQAIVYCLMAYLGGVGAPVCKSGFLAINWAILRAQCERDPAIADDVAVVGCDELLQL